MSILGIVRICGKKDLCSTKNKAATQNRLNICTRRKTALIFAQDAQLAQEIYFALLVKRIHKGNTLCYNRIRTRTRTPPAQLAQATQEMQHAQGPQDAQQMHRGQNKAGSAQNKAEKRRFERLFYTRPMFYTL